MNKLLPTHISLSIAALLLAIPSTGLAATFLAPSNETASVRSALTSDLYTASKSVVVAAPVQGDIFAAGDSIDISSITDQSIFAAGNSISLTGDVRDDVRVAGNIVTLTGSVAHDIFAAGSHVAIAPSASIGGDVYIAGQDTVISGTVQGNVRATGERILVTKDASINGSLTTYGEEPIIEEGAIIKGETKTIARAQIQREQRAPQSILIRSIRSAASHLVLALILLFGAPKLAKHTQELFTKSPVQSAGIGLLWLVLLLPVSILLIASFIGMPVGFFLLLITIPLCIASIAASTLALGGLAYKLMKKPDAPLTWQHALVGAVVLAVLMLLGPIGFIVGIVIFFVGLGSTLRALANALRSK